MRSNYKKLLGAVAVAGLVAAGGSAFTGTGVTSNAGASQFVGGTVNQSVTGAVLSKIAYTFGDASNTGVRAVTLTFADDKADGKVPTVAFTGGTADLPYTCGQIDSTNHVSTCTTTGADRVGVTSIAVTVASANPA